MKSLTPLFLTATVLWFSPSTYAQTGCTFSENNPNMIVTCGAKETQQMILTGVVSPQTLAAESWFSENYAPYQVDTDTLNKLNTLKTATKISVIIGSWCPDCHRETPRFIKIIEALNNPNIQVEYIAVDRNKQDPQQLAAQYDFKRIPTFIVMQNNQEIGRIVESPKISLEQDLAKILLN